MGLDTTHYVIVGYYFSDPLFRIFDEETNEYIMDNFEDNAYSREIKNEPVVITDGFNGNYTFVGIVLAKSVTEKDGGQLPITRCDSYRIDHYERTIQFIRDNIPYIFLDTTFEFGIWTFTHVH